MNTTPLRAIPSAILALSALLLWVAPLSAREKDAEAAARALTAPLEKEGFQFRAEFWNGELKPEMGRAVRVQLFKGNDYRFCVGIPVGSKGKVNAVLLDFEGMVISKAELHPDGWGAVVAARPKKTGLYALAIQLVDGSRDVDCAMTTGWK
jgi:hypothetical protein